MLKVSRLTSLLVLLGFASMTYYAPTGEPPLSAGTLSTLVQEEYSHRFFPETGKSIDATVLRYWEDNGGLAQFGYPLTGYLQERSPVDGNVYTVQYFERAVFELHPENPPPNNVLLSLLGTLEYQRKYPGGAPGQKASTDNPVTFNQTGKTLGGKFREYWTQHGGLRQQGLPISDEFQERSSLDGKLYTVQYFERAVFELHPENSGTPYEVLLSQLGTMAYTASSAAPGTASLDLPAWDPARVPSRPIGSDRYLIWSEFSVNPDPPNYGMGFPPAQLRDTSDVMGMDVRTGNSIIVTRARCDQWYPALSGSAAVWETIIPPFDGPECSSNAGREANRDVAGKDLATGATYDIASGPRRQRHPAVAGKTVVWLEDDDSFKLSRLLAKDLDSGTVTEIRWRPQVPEADITTYLSAPAISEDYVVWGEPTQVDSGTGATTVQVQAYDRRLSTTRSVAQYQTTGPQFAGYRLDGSRLAYYDGGVCFLDLKTGATDKLDIPDMSEWEWEVHNDYVVWSAGPGYDGWDIYGTRLTDRKVMPLVTGKGDQGSPTIAGDWLVWVQSEGRLDSSLRSMPLAQAFGLAP